MTSLDPNHQGEETAALPAHASFSAADKRSHLVQLVLDSVTSPHSKRTYRTGLEQFFSWWAATAPAESFGLPLVQRYRSHLGAGQGSRHDQSRPGTDSEIVGRSQLCRIAARRRPRARSAQ